MLQLQNLSHSFGSRLVIPHVHADILKGQICVITGKNGAGKSVLMKMLLGSLKPSNGAVLLDGRNVAELSKSESQQLFQSTGIIVQDVLPKGVTHVEAFLGMSGASAEDLEKMIQWLGMQGREQEPLNHFSAAERRRLDLGRSLLQSPLMLVWDDPFDLLDHHWREMFLERLKRLNQERGMTIFLSTTHLEEVETLYPEAVIKL